MLGLKNRSLCHWNIIEKLFFVFKRIERFKKLYKEMISRISTRFASKNLTRLFSAQINSVPGNKPPVVEGTVEGRYAGVLFKLSSKNSNLSKINDDMEFLHTLIQESKDFSNFLANGAVKKRELNEVFAQINADFDELTIRFLGIKIVNSRHCYR